MHNQDKLSHFVAAVLQPHTESSTFTYLDSHSFSIVCSDKN